MPIKSVKMNISKNKKMQNVPGQGSFNPINRFLGKMVCFVAREHTDRQIHRLTYTDTEDTLSGFQDVFLQFIIKDRSNIIYCGDVSKLNLYYNILRYLTAVGKKVKLDHIVREVHREGIKRYHVVTRKCVNTLKSKHRPFCPANTA